MGRGLAEQTRQNIYCRAREEAELSRYGASEALAVSMDTLVKYETGAAPVPRETMVLMADVYRAPWLRRVYCARVCPVQNGECYGASEAGHELVAKWCNSVTDTRDIADGMVGIMRDGVVTEDELPQLQKMKEHAEYVKRTAEAFLEWCEMKGV